MIRSADTKNPSEALSGLGRGETPMTGCYAAFSSRAAEAETQSRRRVPAVSVIGITKIIPWLVRRFCKHDARAMQGCYARPHAKSTCAKAITPIPCTRSMVRQQPAMPVLDGVWNRSRSDENRFSGRHASCSASSYQPFTSGLLRFPRPCRRIRCSSRHRRAKCGR